MSHYSQATAINQVPRLHKWAASQFSPQFHKVFDFGAGKKGRVDSFSLRFKGYHPFDPYNRSQDENIRAVENLHECDFVLCSNVLNTLKDRDLEKAIARLYHTTLQTKWKAAFLTVYNGGKVIGMTSRGTFQRHRPNEWYVPFLEDWFDEVIVSGGVIRCYVH